MCEVTLSTRHLENRHARRRAERLPVMPDLKRQVTRSPKLLRGFDKLRCSTPNEEGYRIKVTSRLPRWLGSMPGWEIADPLQALREYLDTKLVLETIGGPSKRFYGNAVNSAYHLGMGNRELISDIEYFQYFSTFFPSSRTYEHAICAYRV